MDPLAVFRDFQPEPGKPLQPQLTALFRRLLTCGRLKVGDQLPPLQQLAELFGTNYFTVNAALKVLVKEHLLERRPRIGTFVRAAQAVPTRVGIYHHLSSHMQAEDSQFEHRLISSLNFRLDSRGISCELFADERPLREQAQPLPRLVEAIRTGRVQQLLVLDSDYSARRWLRAFELPVVFSSYYPDSFCVVQQLPELALAAAAQLRRRNCRSAGLISGVTPNALSPWDRRFHCVFCDALREAGIEYDPTQIITPRDSLGHSRAAFGYHLCNWLLSMEELPEGLFIYPDSLAPGVISALTAAGMGEQFHLVIGKNRELPLFLPFPADLLEFSIEALADELISTLAAAVRGGKPELRFWSFQLLEGASSIRSQRSFSEKEA